MAHPVGPQPALGVTWPNLNGSGPGPRTGEPPYRTTPLYNKDYKLGSVDLGEAKHPRKLFLCVERRAV
ncbi:hypothetical protein N9J96_06565 [Paracoccaceae bacterium]|nr:hypothetical protein [Paracoccaceae bacterium]